MRTDITLSEALALLRTRFPITAEVTAQLLYNNAHDHGGDYHHGLPIIDGAATVVVGYNVARTSWYKKTIEEQTT